MGAFLPGRDEWDRCHKRDLARRGLENLSCECVSRWFVKSCQPLPEIQMRLWYAWRRILLRYHFRWRVASWGVSVGIRSSD